MIRVHLKYQVEAGPDRSPDFEKPWYIPMENLGIKIVLKPGNIHFLNIIGR